MIEAYIQSIATYLPAGVLTNEELAALYPEWPAERIYEKTGIKKRHICAEDQTAADMAVAAAEALFLKNGVNRATIDFLILCTQAPDYILPTTACVIQDRLGLPTSIGALDVNLGCSGYVYCLSLAKGLVASGIAKNVLILTADTYSKFINPLDKSVRTLFGDGATASLIGATGSGAIKDFVFGTDGRGANNLIVKAGMCRLPKSLNTSNAIKDKDGNVRSDENLFMNGAEVMAFSLREVPKAVVEQLKASNLTIDQIDLLVMHQANKFMLDALRKKIGVDSCKLEFVAEDIGNTVSSTIPFALERLVDGNMIYANKTIMLVGFGVGYSWASCIINL